MKEQFNASLTEFENRFANMGTYAQIYIGLGETIAKPDVPEELCDKFRDEQVKLLKVMPLSQKSSMIEFIKWRHRITVFVHNGETWIPQT